MPAAGSRESLVQRALPSFLGLLFAILAIVAVLLLFMVRHVVLVLFVSVLFAAALTGPSEWLHRRFRLPLGLAAVVIYFASFAVIVGIGWFVVPPLLGQVGEFADRAPEYAERFQGIREAYAELRDQLSGAAAVRGAAVTAGKRDPRPCRSTRCGSS